MPDTHQNKTNSKGNSISKEMLFSFLFFKPLFIQEVVLRANSLFRQLPDYTFTAGTSSIRDAAVLLLSIVTTL